MLDCLGKFCWMMRRNTSEQAFSLTVLVGKARYVSYGLCQSWVSWPVRLPRPPPQSEGCRGGVLGQQQSATPRRLLKANNSTIPWGKLALSDTSLLFLLENLLMALWGLQFGVALHCKQKWVILSYLRGRKWPRWSENPADLKKSSLAKYLCPLRKKGVENPRCLIGLLRPPWAVPPELLAVLLPAHYLQHYQGTCEKHLPRNVFGVIWRAAQLSVLWTDTGSGEEKGIYTVLY